ncbi:hypothetical protein [Roseimicrobium gellanilyticum]|uniref:hypothetical protein n=1 Tax=Roseimicrobium gellanilyticum TaxID=748857 RepID=UPI0011BF770F|nr:hypothetical protein [Roseimicrobium gellanilyticum]
MAACRHPWTGWLQLVAWTFLVLAPLPSTLASWSDTDTDGYNDLWVDPNTNQYTYLADLNNQGTDADNDGATNNEEATEGTDPFNIDTDYDGITDGDELHLVKPILGVSLTNWDSDGDTISDYDEWYSFSGVTYPGGQLPSHPGASYSDYDGDGFKNPVDPYPTDPANYSPNNGVYWYGDVFGDADGDIIPNWEDYYPYNSSNFPDADSDGIADSFDPFPSDSSNYSWYNSTYWYGDVLNDSDVDGIQNWQDYYPTDPYNGGPGPDSDGDGFSDSNDPFPNDSSNYSYINSISWYGSILQDADYDGTYNWQDPEPYGPDVDGDGILNSQDPYPNDYGNYSIYNGVYWYGSVLGDSDNDGIPNWSDPEPYSVVYNYDYDGDGLLDSVDPFPYDSTNYSWVNWTSWYGYVLDDWDSDGIVNWSDSWPSDPYNGVPPDPDSDGDGLTLSQESFYGTYDHDTDCDDDGLTDYEELIVYSTGPTNAYSISQGRGWGDLYNDYQLVDATDSDADGIPDRIEVHYGMLPYDAADAAGDLDGNGVTNLAQYNAGLALNVDMALYDADGDGMTDIFEDYYWLAKNNFADAVEDADGDGVLNFEECKLLLSPQDADTFNGGHSLGDLAILMEAMLYPEGGAPTTDANSNGIYDWMDAALVGASPRFTRVAVADLDGDGMPDTWEHQYGRWRYPSVGLYVRHDDATADPDEDDVNNLAEYQLGTHPLIADSDLDGVSDGDEDADGDGLTNSEESQHGTNPHLADTDGDGISDIQEIEEGSDPTDAESNNRLLGLRIYTRLE